MLRIRPWRPSVGVVPAHCCGRLLRSAVVCLVQSAVVLVEAGHFAHRKRSMLR